MQIGEALNQTIELIKTLLPLIERLARLAQTLGFGQLHSPTRSYENLFLNLALDLQDPSGRRAVITSKQRVHFLIEEAGIVTSPIWGEGNQASRYAVVGATKLGVRSDGPRKVLLLGLGSRPEKNSCATIVAKRAVLDGFTNSREYFETTVERPTARLRVTIRFPRGRPPAAADLVTTPGERSERLRVALGRDGRAFVRWALQRPKLQTVYSLRWSW